MYKVSIYSFFAKELLSKGELAVVTTVFKALDREGDGTLSVDELLSKYHQYGIQMTYEQLEKVFMEINMGKARPRELSIISFSQFCMAAMNQTVLISKDKLERAFLLFDADESGEIYLMHILFGIYHMNTGIDRKELSFILNFAEEMSEQEIDDIMKMADKDGDNTSMDKEEFIKLMLKFQDE